MKRIITALLLVFTAASLFAAEPEIKSQWQGKRVAFLGDSITDARQIGTTNDTYWHMFEDILGITPYVYGISGHRMNQIPGQGERLLAEHGQDVDAIIVFVGTNDYNGSIPMGEWYTVKADKTIIGGNIEVTRPHRIFNYDDTFRGRINTTIKWLKTHYPTKQIIFLTPIHRAYATFGPNNIQPDETFSNALGLFIDDYVQAIKDAANIWAVPVIDLNSICGLYPVLDEYTQYFRNAETDHLHPNTEGHKRMAYTLAYQLLAYPAKLD